MEYRTLENTDSVCIYEAFTQAFSDYQVSVDMSFKSFETMLKRNGFMPAVSVGAFADRTLVGFILNGVRDWDNEKTVYDLGMVYIMNEGKPNMPSGFYYNTIHEGYRDVGLDPKFLQAALDDTKKRMRARA